MSQPGRIIISGCSSGGKSTLLKALADQGYETRKEAGRQVVRAEIASGGDALPWLEPAKFTAKALKLAIADYQSASQLKGPVFFDRS